MHEVIIIGLGSSGGVILDFTVTLDMERCSVLKKEPTENKLD
jgi:hypothetical protein